MELGIDLIGAAKAAAGAFMPAVFGPGGAGAPGVAPSPDAPATPVGPGGGVTAQVSPTLQTRISPQISPAMTQIQSSPGAGVMAAPQQYMPGGQTATTPMATAPGSVLPSSQPQYGYSPQPYGAPVPYMGPGGVPTALQPTRGLAGINWTPVIIAGVAGVVALSVFGRRRKRTQ